MRSSFNDCCGQVQWCVTLKLSHAPHLWIWGLTAELIDAEWGWGEEGKAFPQTGSQMSLYLLNNQVIFLQYPGEYKLIKLWTGTFSFLLLIIELVVLGLGMRSQV